MLKTRLRNVNVFWVENYAVNSRLVETNRKKKLEMRLQGRTEDELLDRPLFACCDKYEDVVAVSATGLQCGMNFLNSCLGQLRHADADVDDVVAHVSNKRHRHWRHSVIKWRHTAVSANVDKTRRQLIAVTSVCQQCICFVFVANSSDRGRSAERPKCRTRLTLTLKQTQALIPTSFLTLSLFGIPAFGTPGRSQ